MMKKKINSNHISSLRSVVLAEADFNFNNKILGCRAVNHAEAINDIAPEQYGTRKDKNSIDQALHKHITYDIMKQCKKPGILCSNNVKLCYDRVICLVAALAYKRVGMTQPPLDCMLITIQEMNHHICTSFGLSEQTLQKQFANTPFQGILQGNGVAPTT